ncbi:MAG: hypothetical protein EOO54_18565, partial [Haliea sp.]
LLTHDLAQQWLSYGRASGAGHDRPGEVGYLGLGFRPAGTGFACLDVDDCLDAAGQWSPRALDMFARFPGAGAELSVSGRGLHLWFRFTGQGSGRRGRDRSNTLELYSEGQFIALGTVLAGDAALDCTAAMQALLAEFWPPVTAGPKAVTANDWAEKSPEQREKTKAQILDACRLLPQDSYGEWIDIGNRLCSLGDEDGLPLWHEVSSWSEQYDYDQTEAKWSELAADRTDYRALFAAASRAGWVNPESTAAKVDAAVAGFGLEPVPAGASFAHPAPAAGAPVLPGVQYDGFCDLAEQVERFKGCTYVASEDKVLMPNGSLLSPARFSATMGGKMFVMDAVGEKTEKNAFTAFTTNRALVFPKVDALCFKPMLPFGAVIESHGVRSVNTYRPMGITPVEGDASPWLALLAVQYPDPKDRAILIAWMAACLRYPGRKFQWAVVLQGAEGSAKTLHARILRKALGEKYVHDLDPTKIGGQFNGFMFGRLLIVVEEINIPGNRHDLLDVMKPLITNERLGIEKKGVDAESQEVCANLFLASNHPGGLPATADSRRYAHLCMAQQTAEELLAAGLTEDYFRQLYDWLNGGGYAICANYLLTCEVDERYSPAHQAMRAPATSTLHLALEASMGREEQFIQEAIDNQEPGFAGGWVSSAMVDRLLKDKLGRSVGPRLRGTIMARMGYVHHAKLTDGRVDNPVQPDGKKTRLYVLQGSPLGVNLTPAEIARAYTDSQPINGVGYVPPEPSTRGKPRH